MNTPSHVLINCAAIGGSPSRRLWPALLGGALILRAPEPQIWRQDYFASGVQPVIDALHSFPLILGALAAALAARSGVHKWPWSLGLDS